MNATPLPAGPQSLAPATFKTQVVEVANRIHKILTGDFAEVRRLVESNELVFAVWQDAAETDGIGMLTIKGQHRLREICASGRPVALQWTAIPCVCAEQAHALLQVAGEPDGRH